MTWSTGTTISRDVPPKRAVNSIGSLPSLSAVVASKPMLSTISLFFTYSVGTCTPASTNTAMYGVKPLSVHQSCNARMRYGRVDEPVAGGGAGGMTMRGYLRITFSDGVSASMYAGREKMRSAYFSSGTAFLDMSMP